MNNLDNVIRNQLWLEMSNWLCLYKMRCGDLDNSYIETAQSAFISYANVLISDFYTQLLNDTVYYIEKCFPAVLIRGRLISLFIGRRVGCPFRFRFSGGCRLSASCLSLGEKGW